MAYANSVLGARTNRYADYLDICAAITGRVPRCGLHLEENRKGRILFHLADIVFGQMQQDDFYSALGYLVGVRTGNKIPVIQGLPKSITSDNLKAFGAAAASSGSVALFHAVGITPEADTLEQACHGDAPEQTVEITLSDILQAREDLSSATRGDKLDLVEVKVRVEALD